MFSLISRYLSFVVATLALMLMSTSLGNAEGGDTDLGPVIEYPADAQSCIRPTEFMRRNHMNLLNHKRDETVRNGIRTKDASLQGCVDCHTKKDDKGTHIPVNAEGQFCSTCHEYTAVKLDCFECHRTTPDIPASAAAIPITPEHAGLLANNMTLPGHSTQMLSLKNYVEGIKQ